MLDEIERYFKPRFSDCEITQDKENYLLEIADDRWVAWVGEEDGIGFKMMFMYETPVGSYTIQSKIYHCPTLNEVAKTLREEIASRLGRGISFQK